MNIMKYTLREDSRQIILAVPMLWWRLFSCIVLNLMRLLRSRLSLDVVEHGPVHSATSIGDEYRS